MGQHRANKRQKLTRRGEMPRGTTDSLARTRTEESEEAMQEVLGTRTGSVQWREAVQERRLSEEVSPQAQPMHHLLQTISPGGQRKHEEPLFRGVSKEWGGEADGLMVQPKLPVGEPNDRYEKEADRVAKQVVKQMHTPLVTKNGSAVEVQGSTDQAVELQRVEQLMLGGQAKVGYAASEALEAEIRKSKGGGESFPAAIREPMEQALGADMRDVRMHRGERADALNRSLQSLAFTTGRDIFFSRAAYHPESRTGLELIAHELAHVVQQRCGRGRLEEAREDGRTRSEAGEVRLRQQKDAVQRRLTITDGTGSTIRSVDDFRGIREVMQGGDIRLRELAGAPLEERSLMYLAAARLVRKEQVVQCTDGDMIGCLIWLLKEEKEQIEKEWMVRDKDVWGTRGRKWSLSEDEEGGARGEGGGMPGDDEGMLAEIEAWKSSEEWKEAEAVWKGWKKEKVIEKSWEKGLVSDWIFVRATRDLMNAATSDEVYRMIQAWVEEVDSEYDITLSVLSTAFLEEGSEGVKTGATTRNTMKLATGVSPARLGVVKNGGRGARMVLGSEVRRVRRLIMHEGMHNVLYRMYGNGSKPYGFAEGAGFVRFDATRVEAVKRLISGARQEIESASTYGWTQEDMILVEVDGEEIKSELGNDESEEMIVQWQTIAEKWCQVSEGVKEAELISHVVEMYDVAVNALGYKEGARWFAIKFPRATGLLKHVALDFNPETAV